MVGGEVPRKSWSDGWWGSVVGSCCAFPAQVPSSLRSVVSRTRPAHPRGNVVVRRAGLNRARAWEYWSISPAWEGASSNSPCRAVPARTGMVKPQPPTRRSTSSPGARAKHLPRCAREGGRPGGMKQSPTRSYVAPPPIARVVRGTRARSGRVFDFPIVSTGAVVASERRLSHSAYCPAVNRARAWEYWMGDCPCYWTSSSCKTVHDCIKVGCFSAATRIKTLKASGETELKLLPQLKLGDLIQTSSDRYHPVIGWVQKEGNSPSTFYRIEASQPLLATDPVEPRKKIIEATPGHLIWANNFYMLAERVQPGDFLSNNFTVTKTKKIIRLDGVYSPITTAGTLIIEGEILASGFGRVDGSVSVPGSFFMQWIYDTAVVLFPEDIFHYALKGVVSPIVWWFELFANEFDNDDVSILNMKSWFAFLYLVLNPFLPLISVVSCMLSWAFLRLAENGLLSVWWCENVAVCWVGGLGLAGAWFLRKRRGSWMRSGRC